MKMYKDCRNCVKSDDCKRQIDCSLNGKFPFWASKITGEIVSSTKDFIYVKNHIDEQVYILDTFSQVTPGYFYITQRTESY